MAKAESLIPTILKWETGTVKASGENLEDYFTRCKKKGFANDPADTGGATMCGVTLNVYRSYKGNRALTAAHLKAITYAEWYGIFKKLYWDRWSADQIVSQSVAEILVDWVWASGSYGIIRPQRLLGVKTDGQVGPKTLSALNSKSPLPLWAAIKADRLKYISEIVKAHPAYRKFQNGWLRRINDFTYKE